MFVRVHLPLPAACEQQSDIRIEALYPPNGRPAPEDALQRTVCWEETMTENHEFSVEYDNQVGEIETAERGLGYGEFERSKEVLLCEELPL